MATKEDLMKALQPILDVLKTINPSDPAAAAALSRALPLDGDVLKTVRQLLREGVEARWLCDREAGPIRYSRVQKLDPSGFSIDAVHMAAAGAAHTHPQGEIDLSFAVSGSPTFDGQPEGWVVYSPNTWHTPTVQGGAMDILYFLPGGAMQFGPRPDGATPVGVG